MFDGGNIFVDVEVTFSEVMQDSRVTKDVSVERQEACRACKGTRERAGSESLVCYSCKGEGVKEDALFHKQVRCNTCKGHGKLIKNECGSCQGSGLSLETAIISVPISRFSKDGDQLELDLQGHRTLQPSKGKNGTFIATVRVVEETDRWR